MLPPGAAEGRWGLTETAAADMSSSSLAPPHDRQARLSEFLPIPTKSSLILPQSRHRYSWIGMYVPLPHRLRREEQSLEGSARSGSRFRCRRSSLHRGEACSRDDHATTSIFDTISLKNRQVGALSLSHTAGLDCSQNPFLAQRTVFGSQDETRVQSPRRPEQE